MRVLLFSSTYDPSAGGVETVSRRLAHELRDRSHHIEVLTNRYPRNLAAVDTIDGISVRRRLYPNLIPSPGRRPAVVILKQILSIPLAAFELLWLIRYLRRSRPDVVNVHYLSYPAVYALIAARIAGVPSVLSFHGSDVPSCPYPATYRWVGRAAGRLAAVITCGSNDLANYLRNDLAPVDAAKITVCHFGIDAPAEADSPALDESAPFVVVGRLVEKKGVRIAIAAVEQMRSHSLVPAGVSESGGDSQSPLLIIAGGGPLFNELRRQIADHKLEDSISLLGPLDPVAARALIARSRCVVISSYWEAFGMVSLEAMAAGKPVIASDNGGIAEIVVDGETGLLVPPGDPDALAQAMEAILGDPHRASAMGQAGLARARSRFGWRRVGEEYERLFLIATGNRHQK